MEKINISSSINKEIPIHTSLFFYSYTSEKIWERRERNVLTFPYFTSFLSISKNLSYSIGMKVSNLSRTKIYLFFYLCSYEMHKLLMMWKTLLLCLSIPVPTRNRNMSIQYVQKDVNWLISIEYIINMPEKMVKKFFGCFCVGWIMNCGFFLCLDVWRWQMMFPFRGHSIMTSNNF